MKHNFDRWNKAAVRAKLLNGILQSLKDKGYLQVSLSVQKVNPAVRLYQRAGFKIVLENEDDYVMVCVL